MARLGVIIGISKPVTVAAGATCQEVTIPETASEVLIYADAPGLSAVLFIIYGETITLGAALAAGILFPGTGWFPVGPPCMGILRQLQVTNQGVADAKYLFNFR